MISLIALTLSTLFSFGEAINCMQCNGWQGYYPARYTQVSTCDNRNNQCTTTQYCVKMIDAMNPGTPYVTYKADCYYSSQLQVNPTNLTYIQGKLCYPYQDGSAPVKRYFYCFCNDKDYCNGSHSAFSFTSVILTVLTSMAFYFNHYYLL